MSPTPPSPLNCDSPLAPAVLPPSPSLCTSDASIPPRPTVTAPPEEGGEQTSTGPDTEPAADDGLSDQRQFLPAHSDQTVLETLQIKEPIPQLNEALVEQACPETNAQPAGLVHVHVQSTEKPTTRKRRKGPRLTYATKASRKAAKPHGKTALGADDLTR